MYQKLKQQIRHTKQGLVLTLEHHDDMSRVSLDEAKLLASSSTGIASNDSLARLMLEVDTSPVVKPRAYSIDSVDFFDKSDESATLDSLVYSLSPARENPITMPEKWSRFKSRFQQKNNDGELLGYEPVSWSSTVCCQLVTVRMMSKHTLFASPITEPSAKSLQRTKEAAVAFYSSAYQQLEASGEIFPLAGKNKCLGMVAVPRSRLVMIAISQDSDPDQDILLRIQMVKLLEQINQRGGPWTYELASIPTKAQYLLPRTLSADVSSPAPKERVEPRTRCVEVALMVALNKIGRFKKFTPEETGVMAFGGTLWSRPKDQVAVSHFEGAKRNFKYVEKEPMEVILADGVKGYIDIWERCSNHCKHYWKEMFAIGASGGPATSFSEPRSERDLNL